MKRNHTHNPLALWNASVKIQRHYIYIYIYIYIYQVTPRVFSWEALQRHTHIIFMWAKHNGHRLTDGVVFFGGGWVVVVVFCCFSGGRGGEILEERVGSKGVARVCACVWGCWGVHVHACGCREEEG